MTFFHSCLSLFLYLQGGWTPLHWACYYDHEKIVEMLVTGGADVNAKDKVRRSDRPSWLELPWIKEDRTRRRAVASQCCHEMLSDFVRKLLWRYFCRHFIYFSS